MCSVLKGGRGLGEKRLVFVSKNIAVFADDPLVTAVGTTCLVLLHNLPENLFVLLALLSMCQKLLQGLFPSAILCLAPSLMFFFVCFVFTGGRLNSAGTSNALGCFSSSDYNLFSFMAWCSLNEMRTQRS